MARYIELKFPDTEGRTDSLFVCLSVCLCVGLSVLQAVATEQMDGQSDIY